ncbi:hypothetical protein [Sphingobacterium sp.]|uniref:hypothetical protein n=1 Tax=Sphingobacterium sp. TaxID=341027 RepID=UPI0028AAA8F7|nr:hypothetical protein [Sphingobacterium sp.]
MWYLILYHLMNIGNPTMPIEPIDNDAIIIQSNSDSGDDDPVYGDQGQVRPPRPKK